MKIRNVLLLVLLALLLAGGGAFYYVYQQLDSIVASAIETYGSEAMGTRVSVSSVRISPTTGEGSIRGIRVANPAGFPPGDAFSLGEISITVDLASLTQSPIVVKSVVIGAPVVNAVVDEQGRTNLDVIRRNAETAGGGAASEPSGASGSPTLIRIDRFRFADGKLVADLSALDSKTLEAKLPALDLRRVGGAAGSPPEEVAETIAVAFTQKVGKVLARIAADKLIDDQIGGEGGAAVKSLLDHFMK